MMIDGHTGGSVRDPSPDAKVDFFEVGAGVALRSVNTYGSHGRAVGFTVAGRVVSDNEQMSIVATPVGSDVRRRSGRGSGPNARLVLPGDWDGSYVEAHWFGTAVVRVHPRGSSWSVWRWHDGQAWLPDWYVNLELPWSRTPIGFDSQDWTLDVVARSSDDGEWSVEFKDEDELAFLESTGDWSHERAESIRRAGADAHLAVTSRQWPFEADWSTWVPDPLWEPAALPADWDHVD